MKSVGLYLRTVLLAGCFMAILPEVKGLTGKRIVADLRLAEGEMYRTDFCNSNVKSLDVRAGGRKIGQSDDREDSAPEWGIELLDGDGKPMVEIFLTRRRGNIQYGENQWVVEAALKVDGCSLPTETVTGGIFNTISLQEDGSGHMECWIGDEVTCFVGEWTMPRPAACAAVLCGEAGGGELVIESFNMSLFPAEPKAVMTSWRELEIAAAGEADPMGMVGVYEYLDSDMTLPICRSGGRYRLGLVAAEHGGYDLIYLGGAEENGGEWLPGMLKGKLQPTVFVNHYNLSWVTADKDGSLADLWATFNGPVLELHYPAERGVMRFVRKIGRR